MELSLKRDDQGAENRAGANDEILARAARTDPAAFALLYERYLERVYRYCYHRVGNASEAEDITSQVFVDAIAALPKYRSQGKFAGWLFTLAYRRCADYHRRSRSEPLTEHLTFKDAGDLIDHSDQIETLKQLEVILGGLSEEERELLRLHYAARLTYREIGQVLRRSEGAIKVAMSRLIGKMKSRWEVDDVE